MLPNTPRNSAFRRVIPFLILLLIIICSVSLQTATADPSAYSPQSSHNSAAATDSIGTDSLQKAKARADSLMLARTDSVVKAYFLNYEADYSTNIPQGVSSYSIDTAAHTLSVKLKEGTASQVFTVKKVNRLYSGLKHALPSPVNHYRIEILAFDHEISQLIPNAYLPAESRDTARLWWPSETMANKENEWVKNMSQPFYPHMGLQEAHITVWPSHGRYYDHQKKSWQWQRPRLYCTTEDLFTRSIVIPFLLPMLENAGAVVYCPRERDDQPRELLIDNDQTSPQHISVGVPYDSLHADSIVFVDSVVVRDLIKDGLLQGQYEELVGKEGFYTCQTKGFAHLREGYTNENPFLEGTARMVRTVSEEKDASSFIWLPNVQTAGRYAVYVSYAHDAEAVSDALYTIRHAGVDTRVRVNQRMGYGTWVYLGTYFFSATGTEDNRVTLSNISGENGVITADAVKLGGGMGNILRGDTPTKRNANTAPSVSGLPRYLEGSRYWAQWAGMPPFVYDTKDGRNDYADDINARSNTLNYLAGGSEYEPYSSGLNVPVELSLAVHSDAGYTNDDNATIGTLAISTLRGDGGDERFTNGKSRLWNYDLASIIQDQIVSDMRATCQPDWNRREIYNRNYSESRKPEVPSCIVEMLSHQNFRDMQLGHDPNFKFLLARSIYKGAVKFIAAAHNRKFVIQPLPVKNVAAIADDDSVRLCWEAQTDSLEPTATPTGYIIYTAREGEDFDNGRLVTGHTSATLPILCDELYRFKVSAVNEGGESFPSETLAAMSASEEKTRILIVNGFTRLSSPAVIQTEDSLGFALHEDIGVPYLHTSEYCGAQTGFLRRNAGIETSRGLGYSGKELEGRVITGNTFDYPVVHARAIINKTTKKQRRSISSCSRNAFTESAGRIAKNEDIVDLILGLQKDCDKQSICHYKTFDAPLRTALIDYRSHNGRVLVSGAYIGSDMRSPEERQFTAELMGYDADTVLSSSLTTENIHQRLINNNQAIVNTKDAETNCELAARNTNDVAMDHGRAARNTNDVATDRELAARNNNNVATNREQAARNNNNVAMDHEQAARNNNNVAMDHGQAARNDNKTATNNDLAQAAPYIDSLSFAETLPNVLCMGNIRFSIENELDAPTYACHHMDALRAQGHAKPLIIYSNGRIAAVQKKGVIAIGFPLESIRLSEKRSAVIQEAIKQLE